MSIAQLTYEYANDHKVCDSIPSSLNCTKKALIFFWKKETNQTHPNWTMHSKHMCQKLSQPNLTLQTQNTEFSIPMLLILENKPDGNQISRVSNFEPVPETTHECLEVVIT